jgi:hypothetical protein
MFILRGLIDRVLLVCAVVTGGLVPGFLAQYRQRLGGRLDQARLDLAPWQKIANQFFGGRLHELIAYHLASPIAPIHAEGAVIEQLVQSVRQLHEAMSALHGSLYHQVWYLARHPDPSLLRATASAWVPTFGLSGQALLFAVVFAGCVWLAFQTLWTVTRASGRRIARQLRGVPTSARPAS